MTMENIDKNAVIEKMRQVNERISYLDKQPRVNKTNVAGILESAKVLDKEELKLISCNNISKTKF